MTYFNYELLISGIKSPALCGQEIPAHRINPSTHFISVLIWTVIIKEWKVFEFWKKNTINI